MCGVAIPASEGDAVTPCVHLWSIADAAGPTSQGVCQLCGAKREFCNTLTATQYDRIFSLATSPRAEVLRNIMPTWEQY